MSDQSKPAVIKHEEEQKRFWAVQKNLDVYNLFVQGNSILAIAELLKCRPLTVEKTITTNFFVKRLEHHLRGLMFSTQVAQIIAKDDVFSKLWTRVRDNIEEIPPEICLKELTKLFPQKKEGMVINPKSMNVFMKVLEKSEPEDLGKTLDSMDDDFGFEGLKEKDSARYPELEGPREDGFEQGDPPVDQEKPNKD